MKKTLVLSTLALCVSGAAFAGTVTRSFSPANYTAGQAVTVSLAVDATGASAQAIEDFVPAGWTVSNVSDGGGGGSTRAAWFFIDSNNRTLTYTATAPANASGNQTFTGSGSFDGNTVNTGGSGSISSGGGTSGGTISRSFSPSTYTPGQAVTVSLAVNAGGAGTQAIEDFVPPGWTVSNVSNGGGGSSSRAAWFFLDGTNRTLTYTATPPASASGNQTFTGNGSFDGSSVNTGGSSSISQAAGGTCTTATKLCLDNDRFEITMNWTTSNSNTGPGSVARERNGVLPAGTDNSGAFWFFDAANWEVLIKVLNGCAINNHYWVFFAATTDVGFQIEVTDTVRNTSKMFTNPVGQPANAVTDVEAFATCP